MRKYIILLISAIMLGCSANVAVIDKPQFSFVSIEGSKGISDGILNIIEERNTVVEKNLNWVSQSYRQFMVRELSDIDDIAYPDFKRFLDNGSLYVIVHPAYYTFFDSDYVFTPHDGVVSENAVLQLLKERPYSVKAKLMQAQERMLLDFLEYSSTVRNLVLIVLPGDYADAPFYRYSNRRDEYMRYINEITNESDSVLILYSKKPNKGSLAASDQKRLIRFLSAVAPDRILLGGGYIGRCVEDFYKDLSTIYSREKIYVVPEITAWSPSDISSDQASALLRPDGTADIAMMTKAADRKLQTAKKTNLQLMNLGN